MAKIWTMGELLVEIMRPKPDMPLNESGSFLGPFPSGAPGIFIDTAARLGVPAAIIGGVGSDDFGKCILERLKNDGVDCKHVLESENNATGVAFVTYFADGSRKFIYHIGNTPAAEAKMPDLADEECDFFHIMGCSLMSSPSFANEIVKTMEQLVKRGAKVSFDPNIRPELMKDDSVKEVIGAVVKNCAVLQPGEQELLEIGGKSTIAEAVKSLFENPVLEVITLKRGSKGSTVFTRNEKVDLGVYEIVPVDPTGAGDSFDAAFLCGILAGKSYAEAAKMATAAAALNTAAFGPMEGKISPENIENMMNTMPIK